MPKYIAVMPQENLSVQRKLAVVGLKLANDKQSPHAKQGISGSIDSAYKICIVIESPVRTRLTVEGLSSINGHGTGYIPQSLPNSYGPA